VVLHPVQIREMLASNLGVDSKSSLVFFFVSSRKMP
jgi:hypothetical protein